MKPQIWAQLKNITADELINALLNDGAVLDDSHGSARVYKLKSGLKIAIHYHPRKTFGPQLLSDLLETIGWTEQDLKRLKLIKK
jgi:predicted RNA binding protein YcfA (HicA-like mRNA interferase family)